MLTPWTPCLHLPFLFLFLMSPFLLFTVVVLLPFLFYFPFLLVFPFLYFFIPHLFPCTSHLGFLLPTVPPTVPQNLQRSSRLTRSSILYCRNNRCSSLFEEEKFKAPYFPEARTPNPGLNKWHYSLYIVLQ